MLSLPGAGRSKIDLLHLVRKVAGLGGGCPAAWADACGDPRPLHPEVEAKAKTLAHAPLGRGRSFEAGDRGCGEDRNPRRSRSHEPGAGDTTHHPVRLCGVVHRTRCTSMTVFVLVRLYEARVRPRPSHFGPTFKDEETQ